MNKEDRGQPEQAAVVQLYGMTWQSHLSYPTPNQAKSQHADEDPLRTLVFLAGVGSLFFVGLFSLVLFLLFSTPGGRPDPSAFNFYPIMAGLGVMFGFERWWAYEQGEYNPFHPDSRLG